VIVPIGVPQVNGARAVRPVGCGRPGHVRYNINVTTSSGDHDPPEGWPRGIPHVGPLPEARPREPGETQRDAARLLRWIDEYPGHPPADREPLEHDPVRRNQLYANLGRTLREREARRRRNGG